MNFIRSNFKYLSLLIILLVFTGTTYAQEPKEKEAPSKQESKKGFSSDRIFTGGSFALSFYRATYIDISPMVGYRITDRWAAGIGGTYIYYRIKFRDFADNEQVFSTSYYGARIFSRYYIHENVFAHGEYEWLNIEYFDFPAKWRIDIGSLLLGGGYTQNMSSNSSWYILVLYNFNESRYSSQLLPNPIIRFGMTFGL